MNTEIAVGKGQTDTIRPISVVNLTGYYLRIGSKDVGIVPQRFPCRNNNIVIQTKRSPTKNTMASSLLGVPVVTLAWEGNLEDIPVFQKRTYIIVQKEVAEAVLLQRNRIVDDLLFPEEFIGIAYDNCRPQYQYRYLMSFAVHNDWYPSQG